MFTTPKVFTKNIAGRDLIIEIGKLANQTNGSCTVQYGDTQVLATAVMGKNTVEGLDYFPLMVDYEERLYAAGKIKGSRFIKREGRPTDEAVLTARLIDRSIRPLFNDSIRNEVQVVITALSVDGENDTDFPAMIAASCALAISDIPWNGPIAGVSVGEENGTILINPTVAQRATSSFDIFISGLKEKTLMIECAGKQVAEDTCYEALLVGQKHVAELIGFLEEIQNAVGRPKALLNTGEQDPKFLTMLKNVSERVETFANEKISSLFPQKNKAERVAAVDTLFAQLQNTLQQEGSEQDFISHALKHLNHLIEMQADRLVFEKKRRVDGRKLDEIRELSCEVGVLPRTHGTGLFTRGETQVLSVLTLGAPGDEQVLDGMEDTGTKRYMHHYNFPGFSVGEVKPMRSPGRREIGHGALAEKALVPVIPTKLEFPYTIRIVSEVLSSNGSSSQASICGSTLALMDAGVPIKAPVAGIAMGIIMHPTDESIYEIITDIQGIEDHSGGMDFKIAGTRQGLTAIQLDVKIKGLTAEMIKKTFEMAKKARLEILDVMETTLAAPREELSPHAPRILSMTIDPEKIRDVIGKGGETINTIIEECGGRDLCKIDIEDDGLVMVTSKDMESAKKAITYIENLTRDIAVGEEYEGIVTKIITDRNSGSEIGAIVELLPGKDGMVHISEFSDERIAKVSDVVKVGDSLKVRVVDVDKEKGRVSLSHRVIINGGNMERPRNGNRQENGRKPRNGYQKGPRNDRPNRRR